MAFNAYATSLRGERLPQDRVVEEGVPFFVPQLSKVKTNVMCQSKNQHLLFCFEKANGASSETAVLASASYRKQGNQDFYSPENLVKRQRLLEDKQVVAALARFWDTFPHIRQGAQTLECRDYVDVFMKFYKALVSPSEFSMGEARRIVERDWERDMGATDTMTRGVFLRALFEVADIWTVGIGADIYSSFLNKLYDRVTMTVYDKEKCMWLTIFADIDKIRPFGEPKSDTIGSSVEGAASLTSGIISNTNLATTTNQGLDTAMQSGASGTATASVTSSTLIAKSKPPLLKKKMLSVPSGLGSPTKSGAITMLGSAEAMGGSLRRLPDLQAVATEAVRTMNQGIASRAPRSPVPQSIDAVSSRRDGGAASPPRRLENNHDNTNGGEGPATKAIAGTRLSMSPTRTTQRSAATRRDSMGTALSPSKRKKEDDSEPAQSSAVAPVTPDVPPQQVRLSMPSIYLSPEIAPSHSSEKAARRRIRESMKLAQRLRRITF